jgi:transcription factor C subunit 6
METEEVEEEISAESEDEKSVVSEKPTFKKPPRKPSSRGKGKTATTPRSSKRSPYSLPAPVVHHRHRAASLFSRPGRVERLTERPNLFSSCSLTLTNSFTTIPDRVTKSWGFNFGPGPLWDLVEDRGWFKEAEVEGKDVDSEAKRRPRVYQDICVREGWQLLTEKYVFAIFSYFCPYINAPRDAAPYLPTKDVASGDGFATRPAALQCYFGPISSQHLREIQTFDSFAMCPSFSFILLLLV